MIVLPPGAPPAGERLRRRLPAPLSRSVRVPTSPDARLRHAAHLRERLASEQMPPDLESLARAVIAVSEVDQEIIRAVVAARARGRSWRLVGLAMGMSRQAVRTRFGASNAGA